MNTNVRAVLLAFLLSTISYQPSTLLGQGALTPPGAPAPTMKSLDQIEARTPISSLPFIISSSGSYYLTKNLSVTTGNALTINASQVTVDLNGFTISSTASSANGTGIALASGLADIAIFNGHIKGGVTYSGGTYSGPGFANGIEYSGTTPTNARVTGVSVVGCQFDGIYVGTNSVVESCTVQTIGGDGIVGGGVFRSTATECGNGGIAAHTASDCYALITGSGTALSAVNAINCEGQSNGGIGLYAYTASNCYGSSSSGTGMSVVTTAINCQGVSSGGGDGLDANNASNCYGSSTSGYGLSVVTTAINCFGQSNTFTGLSAYTANNCFGQSFDRSPVGVGLSTFTANNCWGESGGGYGLSVSTSANNCFGESGTGSGLYATNATNCFATTSGAAGQYAINVSGTASYCRGQSFGAATGLAATIAIGCTGSSASGTAISATNKYLMP
jgi:hypothetical protein